MNENYKCPCLYRSSLVTNESKEFILLGFFFCLLELIASRIVETCLLSSGCESWTVKKAERQRIDAFELRCWRRLLRVSWTARRSNQSILKEISPGCSLEGMMLRLKLQYFGHLMWRVDSLEKTLMLGEIGGRSKRGKQRMRWLDGITDSMGRESEWTPGVGDRQGGLACCDSWRRKESDMTELLNWTEAMW